jgi:hypothetical protein
MSTGISDSDRERTMLRPFAVGKSSTGTATATAKDGIPDPSLSDFAVAVEKLPLTKVNRHGDTERTSG